MGCEREILSRLLESNSVDETTFVYNGNEYHNKFGKYMCNKKPISKEEYHRIRNLVLAQQDEEGTLNYDINLPSKKLAKRIDRFHKYIDSLEYDETYYVGRETREGHLPRIDKYDKEARMTQIFKDTQFGEEDCAKLNTIISEYTSTDNYYEFTDESRKLLNSYLEVAPVFTPPPLYRGMGFSADKKDVFNMFKDLSEGYVTTFEDFTSFSSNPDIAVEFAYANGEYQVYIVNTKNLTGVSIDHLSSLDYLEDELLYSPDTKLALRGKVVKGKTVYLHMEELSLYEDDYGSEEIIELPLSGRMIIK